MSAVDEAFGSALASLRERYLSTLGGPITELKKFAVLCEFGEAGTDVTTAIGQLAHRLGGTGETLGFPNVSSAAAALERVLAFAPRSIEAGAAARALAQACEAASGSPHETQIVAEAGPPPKIEEISEELPPILPRFVAIHSDGLLATLLGDVCAGRANMSNLASCVDAIEFLDHAQTDLLVLDLDCPGCSQEGVTALYRKARLLKIPIVATTSNRRSAAILHALSDGEVECLFKPIEAAVLHKKLFETLERQRLVAILCDDDPLIREFLKPRFEARGFEVVLAKDGDELLQLAGQVHPSIIVLDRVMPGLDGLDVLRLLKSKSATHNVPVVMLTSKNQPNEVADGMRSGAAAYLFKPFSPDQVLAKCLDILGLKRSQRV